MNWILWFNGWKWAFVMHYFAIRGHYSMNMLFAHDLLPLFHIINCTVGYINMSFTESCRWTKSLYAHDHAWITSLCLIHEKAVQSMSLLIERWRLCLCFFYFFYLFFYQCDDGFDEGLGWMFIWMIRDSYWYIQINSWKNPAIQQLWATSGALRDGTGDVHTEKL